MRRLVTLAVAAPVALLVAAAGAAVAGERIASPTVAIRALAILLAWGAVASVGPVVLQVARRRGQDPYLALLATRTALLLVVTQASVLVGVRPLSAFGLVTGTLLTMIGVCTIAISDIVRGEGPILTR